MNGRSDFSDEDWMTFADETPNVPQSARTDAPSDCELGFAADCELGFAADADEDANEDAELGFAEPGTISGSETPAVPVHWEVPFDPNWTDQDGNTPLHYAVDRRDLELVCELTAHGVPLNAPGHGRVTALERAAWNGDLAIVRHLVENGAEVNSAGGRWSAPLTELDGEFYDRIYLYGPPLYAAASRGHFEVVKYLISQGADINARDFNGRTVLHAAARADSADCMQYLQALGAE